MAHDELGIRMVCRHLIQGQGVAVFQMGPGEGGQPHVNGHRLTVTGCQAVDGLVHGVRQSDLVVPGVQLHAAAVVPPQVRLHPVRQVRDHPAPVLQQAAVQAHAVVEQVCGVVVPPELQTVISHHHAVGNVQFSIDLPQMVYVVVMAHLPGHLLGRIFRKQVQVGVDDLHTRSSPSSSPRYPAERRFFNTAIITEFAAFATPV